MIKGSFNRLLASIQTVRGVGPATARNLRARQIETLEDALFFLPSRYQDRRTLTPLAEVEPGREALVKGRPVKLGGQGFGRRRRLSLELEDETGRLAAIWFRLYRGLEERLESAVRDGYEVVFFGQADLFQDKPVMVHPEMIPLADLPDHLGRFHPVYREIPGVSGPRFRQVVRRILEDLEGRLTSPLPEPALAGTDLLDLSQAFRRVHFPETEADISPQGRPRRTLVYTELFLFQAGLALLRRRRWDRAAPRLTAFDKARRRVGQALGFRLTSAQERVLDELGQDLTSSRPMNRLLQGDVGSGKTALAGVALLAAALSGAQAALMAPTEILAEQHCSRLAPLAEELGVAMSLLTGSAPAETRKGVLKGLAEGRIQVAVGTHALIQEGVSFANLALAVIDEQHRFGVLQRASLGAKGQNPHLLVMTATPIPRSLCLTLYGDLDVSLLDEKPPGRRPVITRILPPERIERAWRAIRNAAAQGLQAYVVLPAIDSGQGLASAEARFAALGEIMPELRLGLLHGRLAKEEQMRVMAGFAKGDIQVLVATTVVEVGLDVARAAVMVIEEAERFGLAQIHQLRGRVGRGGTEAACLLISAAQGQALERLKVLERTEDGFAVAEADLLSRGPGELAGARQAGFADFRLANLFTDLEILKSARQAAFDLIESDPDLNRPDHLPLKEILTARWLRRLALSRVG